MNSNQKSKEAKVSEANEEEEATKVTEAAMEVAIKKRAESTRNRTVILKDVGLFGSFS